MKKTLLALCVVLISASIIVLFATSTKRHQNDDRWLQNVEALIQTENPCLAGGPGAISCEITADEGLGGGMTHCSVTCEALYYACCSVSGCNCVPKFNF